MEKIIWGDNTIELKLIPENSVDAIVTDPPYEIGFMGKSWDNTGIANNPLMWAECLRVLKPGGYLLSFGGTRTYHRMAVAIEDAGFEVRDMIEWVYGSGFPKSLNIGKAVDKLGGESLSWFIDYILQVADEKGISRKELTMLFPSKNGNPTGWLWNKQKTQGITLEQYHKIKEFLQLPFSDISECEREVIGRGKAGLTAGTIANFAGEKEFDLTKGTSEYEGWGTALKPAHEPICMARKPLAEKTVAENVLKYGTGGINIDESRVDTITEADKNNFHQNRKVVKEYKADDTLYELGMKTVSTAENSLGRFPANLIHDNSEEVRECFPDAGKGNGKGAYNYAGREYDNKDTSMFNGDKPQAPSNFNDSGNASRFFKSIIYQAKASKSERNKGCEELEEKNFGFSGGANGAIGRGEDYEEGQEIGLNRVQKMKNNHPTVKPIALMEYLIQMVTREGGTVLDPFMGSGSTGVAAKNLNRNFIGIEISPEYVEIAEKRIEAKTQSKFV